jgi:hypothetical protein
MESFIEDAKETLRWARVGSFSKHCTQQVGECWLGCPIDKKVLSIVNNILIESYKRVDLSKIDT